MKTLRRVFGSEPKDKQAKAIRNASNENTSAVTGPSSSSSRVPPAPAAAPATARPSLPMRIFGKNRSQSQVSTLPGRPMLHVGQQALHDTTPAQQGSWKRWLAVIQL